MTVYAGNIIYASDINSIFQEDSNNVDTLESTASTAFTNLATVGPTVTLTLIGTSVTVTVSVYMNNSAGGNNGYMGCAVSGASTVAASDSKSASNVGTNAVTASNTFEFTGLTPGINVFTAKYRVSAGTGNFVYRWLTVTARP